VVSVQPFASAGVAQQLIAGIGEELAGLGGSAARVEHWRRGLVGEQARGALRDGEQPLVNLLQQESGFAYPVGEGRTIENDALPGIDLGLAVERQITGVFGDRHLSDRRLGRYGALDQPRRWRYHARGPVMVISLPYDGDHRFQR
jgi:hypothetical protein